MDHLQTYPGYQRRQIKNPRELYLILFSLCFSLIGTIAFIFDIELLLVISGLGLSFVILLRPFWGLLLFTLLLPLESSYLALGGGVTTITRILGIYIFGVWVINLIINKKGITFPKILLAAYGLIFWGATSLLWAEYRSAAIGRVETGVQLAILLLLVLNSTNSRERLKSIIFALLLGSLIITLLGLLGVGVADYTDYLTLAGQGAKEYGSYVGVVLLIGSIYLFYKTGLTRWLGFLAVLVAMIALIRVNQRGVLLGVGAAWLGLTIVTKQKFKTIFLIMLLLLIFNISIDILFERGFITDTLVSRLTIENIIETGGTGRTEIWDTGWRMFLNNFLLGTGINNFPIVYPEYAKNIDVIMNTDPHSDIVSIAGELGIVGIVLYLVFISKLILDNYSELQKSDINQTNIIIFIVFSLLIFYFSVGLTSTLIWRKINWVIYGMGISVAYLINKDLSNKNQTR